MSYPGVTLFLKHLIMETSICLLRMEFSIGISISIIYHCYKVEALPLLFYPSGQVVINGASFFFDIPFFWSLEYVSPLLPISVFKVS